MDWSKRLSDAPSRERRNDAPFRGPAAAHTDARVRRAPFVELPVTTLPQPDETTCGPTCLHAIYAYWGDEEPLASVIRRARRLDHGGTYAVFLGCDALRRGYSVRIYTCNLTVFDPSWFGPHKVD